MLNNQPQEAGQGTEPLRYTWLKSTSTKIKAIGTNWKAFSRAIGKITFAPKPVHVPDEQLINDVAMLLLTGDNPRCLD